MGLFSKDAFKDVKVAERLARMDAVISCWEAVPVTTLAMMGMAGSMQSVLVAGAIADTEKAAGSSKTAQAVFSMAGRPDLSGRMAKAAARTRSIQNDSERTTVLMLMAASIAAFALPESLKTPDEIIALLGKFGISG